MVVAGRNTNLGWVGFVDPLAVRRAPGKFSAPYSSKASDKQTNEREGGYGQRGELIGESVGSLGRRG